MYIFDECGKKLKPWTIKLHIFKPNGGKDTIFKKFEPKGSFFIERNNERFHILASKKAFRYNEGIDKDYVDEGKFHWMIILLTGKEG